MVQKVPWVRDPHTGAKHDLYANYFAKWFPILMRGFGGNIVYAEGFSGPGIYTEGEPGSPVLALQAALSMQPQPSKTAPIKFVLVDADRRCISMLRERMDTALAGVETVPEPDALRIEIAHGPCEQKLPELLYTVGAWDRPRLAVLDSFGGAVSAELLRMLSVGPAPEVIITILPQHFTRFATDPDHQGDEVFGTGAWRQVVNVPADRKTSFLIDQYRQTVKRSGFHFVTDFELVDKRGHSLYLVHGTSHPRGLEKIKEAMWAVDPSYGIGYRDPRDPAQQTLDITFEPVLEPLKRLLLRHLTRTRTRSATVRQLRDFALYETFYKPGQVRGVLRDMVRDGVITRDDSRGDLNSTSVVRPKIP